MICKLEHKQFQTVHSLGFLVRDLFVDIGGEIAVDARHQGYFE